MSNTMKMSLSTKPMHPFSRKQMGFSENPIFFKAPNLIQLDLQKLDLIKTRVLASFRGEAASVAQSLDNSLMSIPLQQILSEEHFNRVIDQQSVIIVWVANWCRKCIYLKPKLEKLAAHYHPSIRFYSVDVNNVSHKLVSQAEVTKMPTIQLWSDGKKQGEVIGGHNKAFLAVNEVRDMIENESSSL